MIILDTNVVSELMRPEPAPQVADWVRRRDRRELRTTSITLAEIRYGIARLPDGRRKQILLDAVNDVFQTFSDQVLSVDEAAAERPSDGQHDLSRGGVRVCGEVDPHGWRTAPVGFREVFQQFRLAVSGRPDHDHDWRSRGVLVARPVQGLGHELTDSLPAIKLGHASPHASRYRVDVRHRMTCRTRVRHSEGYVKCMKIITLAEQKGHKGKDGTDETSLVGEISGRAVLPDLKWLSRNDYTSTQKDRPAGCG
jgi:toxin FitB